MSGSEKELHTHQGYTDVIRTNALLASNQIKSSIISMKDLQKHKDFSNATLKAQHC